MAVHWTLNLCLSTFSIKSVPKRSILSIRQPAEKELLDKLAKTAEPLSRKRPLSSISLIQLSTVKGIGVEDGVEPKISDYFCSNICCGPSSEDSKIGLTPFQFCPILLFNENWREAATCKTSTFLSGKLPKKSPDFTIKTYLLLEKLAENLHSTSFWA